jgi:endonuclease/exonuclease/phosphatase (EEP) superfamily protein YafD
VFLFDLALFACAIFLVALFARRRWLALASAAVSLILLSPSLALLFPKSASAPSGPTVRVMSINLEAGNHSGDAILHQIRQANPDIIALQEYTDWCDDLLQRQLSDYPYRVTVPSQDSTGDAIYSKIPLWGEVQLPHTALGTRMRLRAVFRIDGQEVVMYAIHPSSPHRYSNILRNRLQTADLIDDLRRETSPVIIAGDFNATDNTPNLQAYRNFGLVNTQDVAGIGRGSTWPDTRILRHFPGFRIDHILIDRRLTCTNTKVCGPTGSDHRPIIADIAYSRNPSTSVR